MYKGILFFVSWNIYYTNRKVSLALNVDNGETIAVLIRIMEGVILRISLILSDLKWMVRGRRFWINAQIFFSVGCCFWDKFTRKIVARNVFFIKYLKQNAKINNLLVINKMYFHQSMIWVKCKYSELCLS
jgi:hypothetical protein